MSKQNGAFRHYLRFVKTALGSSARALRPRCFRGGPSDGAGKNTDSLNEKLRIAREAAGRYKRAVQDKQQGLLKVREALLNSRETLRNSAPFPLLIKNLESVRAISHDLKAEMFLAVTAEAVPYAVAARDSRDVRLFCDATEIPDLGVRTLKPKWGDSALELMNKAVQGYLSDCDGFLTVGWELGKHLDGFNVPVYVFPNYRYREEFEYSDLLRAQLSLEPDDKIVMAMSTIATGFEVILRAIASLPKNIHLVVLGSIVPDTYAEEMDRLSLDLGVKNRVHVISPVPYAELTKTISSAEVGLIVRDPNVLNNFVSLPNRIFDYMFGGVPVVSAYMPDIAQVVEQNEFGEIIREPSSSNWATAISNVLQDHEVKSKNALLAAEKLVWESQEDAIFDALGCPASVSIFGQKNLLKHNRTMRIARTLVDRGCNVKLVLNKTYIADSQQIPAYVEVIGY